MTPCSSRRTTSIYTPCPPLLGELQWKFQSQGPLHATPALSGGLAYVTGCDSILRGIRLEDGIEVTQIDSGAYTAASPALVNGVAYYGTFNNDVLAVDLHNQKYLWRYEHPERHFPFYSSAAVFDGKVVVEDATRSCMPSTRRLA